MEGRFITFEGGEGVGKSTQIHRLAERLEHASVDVLVTREPGGTGGAEAIRHVLLSGAAKSFGAAAESMLFAAARIDHVDHRIRPALERGTWVLCDRFTDSTRVYQGEGGADETLLRTLEAVATMGLKPDLTIVLDAPAEVGLARAATRTTDDGQPVELDRFETDQIDVHTRRRQAFLDIAAAEPQRCAVIDATRSADETANAIERLVRDRLGDFGPVAEEHKEESIAFASVDAALELLRGTK